MALDHEAIYEAYKSEAKPVVSVDDTAGAFDADGNSVTLDQSKIDAARVELDKLNYRRHRVGTGTTTGYIDLKEQLDQLYRDINAGKFGADAKTGEWFVGITSVKTSYPKPS